MRRDERVEHDLPAAERREAVRQPVEQRIEHRDQHIHQFAFHSPRARPERPTVDSIRRAWVIALRISTDITGSTALCCGYLLRQLNARCQTAAKKPSVPWRCVQSRRSSPLTSVCGGADPGAPQRRRARQAHEIAACAGGSKSRATSSSSVRRAGCRWRRRAGRRASRAARRRRGSRAGARRARRAALASGATSGRDCGAACRAPCTAHRRARGRSCRRAARCARRARARSASGGRCRGRCAPGAASAPRAGGRRRRRRRGGRCSRICAPSASVLPPAPAQKSTTISPRRAPTSSASSWLPSSCTSTEPSREDVEPAAAPACRRRAGRAANTASAAASIAADRRRRDAPPCGSTRTSFTRRSSGAGVAMALDPGPELVAELRVQAAGQPDRKVVAQRARAARRPPAARQRRATPPRPRPAPAQEASASPCQASRTRRRSAICRARARQVAQQRQLAQHRVRGVGEHLALARTRARATRGRIRRRRGRPAARSEGRGCTSSVAASSRAFGMHRRDYPWRRRDPDRAASRASRRSLRDPTLSQARAKSRFTGRMLAHRRLLLCAARRRARRASPGRTLDTAPRRAHWSAGTCSPGSTWSGSRSFWCAPTPATSSASRCAGGKRGHRARDRRRRRRRQPGRRRLRAHRRQGRRARSPARRTSPSPSSPWSARGCSLPTLFALTYAAAYYGPEPDARPHLPRRRRGFEPAHTDFLYFSFTIAVTAQTSDIAVSTREMRRLVLGPFGAVVRLQHDDPGLLDQRRGRVLLGRFALPSRSSAPGGHSSCASPPAGGRCRARARATPSTSQRMARGYSTCSAPSTRAASVASLSSARTGTTAWRDDRPVVELGGDEMDARAGRLAARLDRAPMRAEARETPAAATDGC